MNDHKSSRFSEGFFLGLILGAALVFLFGTKQGKNLVKILSEQGIEGISDILKDYDLGEMEDEDLSEQDVVDEDSEEHPSNAADVEEDQSASASKTLLAGEKPRKRFFKRFKRSN